MIKGLEKFKFELEITYFRYFITLQNDTIRL